MFLRARVACFIAPVTFSVLWPGGRGRALISVPWLFHAAREACSTADTEYLSPRTRSVLHRAAHFFRAAAGWTREDMPTVLWRSLFRGFLIFRFEKILCSIYALDARAHKVCSIVQEIFSVRWSAFVRYFTVAKRHLLQKQSPIAPKNLRGFGCLNNCWSVLQIRALCVAG